jgi:hypothetical protein
MIAPLRVSVLASVATLAALAVGGGSLLRSEGMIERTYTGAFDQMEQERGMRPVAASSRTSFDPAHVHLSHLPAAAALGPSVAIGDRITLAQRAGGVASYEVIDVRPLPRASLTDRLGGDGNGKDARLLLVTAATSGQLPTQTVRFIIDADAPARPAPATRPHAL